jgi:hypothetical protein
MASPNLWVAAALMSDATLPIADPVSCRVVVDSTVCSSFIGFAFLV